ncbi:MAG: hypothetical protein GY711_08530 [bacterium]|nr:hypothetical protein [bacterium]
MSDATYPATTNLLLSGLFHREDAATWCAYVRSMRPILAGTARRMGLCGPRVDDAVQRTLLRVLVSGRRGGYDRNKGRLRCWVMTILHNVVIDALRTQRNTRDGPGASAFFDLPTEAETEAVWRDEAMCRLQCEMLRVLRERSGVHVDTLKAFQRIVFDGASVAATALELGMTNQAVHLAKHRCLTHLRAHAAELRPYYELTG